MRPNQSLYFVMRTLLVLLALVHCVSAEKQSGIEDRIFNRAAETTEPSTDVSTAMVPWRQVEPDCGIPPLSINMVHRILAGDKAPAELVHNWPWLVRINITVNSSTGVRYDHCAGNLIASDVVLTAAHCAYKILIDPTALSVSWSLEFGFGSRSAQVRHPVQIIRHPEYQKDLSAVHDIALLKLNDSVPYNIHIRPVCLPDQPLLRCGVGEDVFATVAGWGLGANSSTSLATELNQAEVNITCNCTAENVICGFGHGGKHQDTCKGDSGGPLVQLDTSSDRMILHGVTHGSADRNTSKEFPFCGKGGEYVDVYHNRDWLVSTFANLTDAHPSTMQLSTTAHQSTPILSTPTVASDAVRLRTMEAVVELVKNLVLLKGLKWIIQ